MTAAAGRPLNWNVLTIDASVPDRVPRQLEASERARRAGGRIVALTMPILTPMNMSLGTFCALNLIPGWGEILGLPVPERIEKLRDPAVRAEMLRRADSKEAGVFRRLADFGRYVIGDTYSPQNDGLSGRVVRDIAAERGQDAFATAWSRSAPTTSCARSCGRCPPTTTPPPGSCAGRRGSTRTSCSAAPTRARTWTGCAERRTPPASSATVCAAAGCSRWRTR